MATLKDFPNLAKSLKGKPLTGNAPQKVVRVRSKKNIAACKAEGVCKRPNCPHKHDKYNPIDPHHLVPRSQGGGDEPSNLLAVCRETHKEAHRDRGLLEELKVIAKSLAEGRK